MEVGIGLGWMSVDSVESSQLKANPFFVTQARDIDMHYSTLAHVNMHAQEL